VRVNFQNNLPQGQTSILHWHGFKDTVMVMPGERVKLLMKFEKYSGLFAYHCHTLEHEDAGMMRNYRVIG
jgi:FtsP/CotA-like multicopper oxidase with cupredoxin domain